MTDRRLLRKRQGFSLTELLIVVAIILVMTAVAVPNFINAMRSLRLRSSATTVANILQQARLRAVRDNTFYKMAGDIQGSSIRVFVDALPLAPGQQIAGNNGVYFQGDPAVLLAANVQFVAAGTPPTGTMQLVPAGGPAPQPAGTPPAFNARGLPCLPAGALCNTVAGGGPVYYVSFLQDPSNANAWAAVSVSPTGRIRAWEWDAVGARWSPL